MTKGDNMQMRNNSKVLLSAMASPRICGWNTLKMACSAFRGSKLAAESTGI